MGNAMDEFLDDLGTNTSTGELEESDWFSVMDLVDMMEVSRSKVTKHLRQWNREGRLERDCRKGERIDGRKCQIPVYRVLTDEEMKNA